MNSKKFSDLGVSLEETINISIKKKGWENGGKETYKN